MKKNVLIIGAGGVAQVVAHKCPQNNDVLGDIHIASRTKAKCDAIIASVHEKKAMKQAGVLESPQLDALDIEATKALIKKLGTEIVINVGTAFLNMSVLRACMVFDIPLIGLRGISDGVVEVNHINDWTEYLHVIDEKLAAAVGKLETAIESGALKF